MGRAPTEEVELVATRVPVAVAKQLRGMADAEGRAIASLARVILENFFYAGLPPQMRSALEEDERRLQMNRRDYINHLLFERLQVIQKAGVPSPKARR